MVDLQTSRTPLGHHGRRSAARCATAPREATLLVVPHVLGRSPVAPDPPRERRALAGLARACSWPALVLAVLALMLGDLARRGWVTGVDLAVRALALPRPLWLEQLAPVVDHMGLGAVIITVLLATAAVACCVRRSWLPLGLVLVSLFGLYSVVWSLKVLLARGRSIDDVVTLFSGGQAWPSGHAANVAFAAVLLTHLVRLGTGRSIRRRTPVLAVAVPSAVMAATSLYLGYHWASDLVGGMLVGLLVGEMAVRLDARYRACPDRRLARLEDSQRLSQAPLRVRVPR